MTADPRELLPLKPLVFQVLLALQEGERHGWSLVRSVQERDGFSRIMPGNFYRTLRAMLGDLGLGKAISALCERLGEQSGIAIGCDIDPELPQLAPEAELVTYRVAQEALTNTLRHSGAQRAAVTLEQDGEDVLLTVADDGRGLGDSDPGAGIQGMRERALLIGARFRIDPGEEAEADGGEHGVEEVEFHVMFLSFGWSWERRVICRLEVGDTAGWKPALRAVRTRENDE